MVLAVLGFGRMIKLNTMLSASNLLLKAFINRPGLVHDLFNTAHDLFIMFSRLDIPFIAFLYVFIAFLLFFIPSYSFL